MPDNPELPDYATGKLPGRRAGERVSVPMEDGSSSTLRVVRASKPRAGRHSDQPGSYELVLRLEEHSVDPGRDLRIDGFITGYGQIGAAKVGVWPQHHLFDTDKCFVRCNLKNYPDGSFSFGSEEFDGNTRSGVVSFVGGLKMDSWAEMTMFFDVLPHLAGDIPKISTECFLEGAPLALRLRLKDKARPGSYELPFVLSYFNGVEWKSSRSTAKFEVTTFWERHPELVALATILGTLTALVALLK